MATAGYNLKFGNGYLGGRKEPGEKARPQEHESGDAHEEIHEHLRSRHAATGHAHSHVEHHGDGRHTSHHVDEAGEVSGPIEHESDEDLHNHMSQFGGGSPEGDGEEEGE